MERTFGFALRQFCWTSPNIDRNLFSHIIKKVRKYVETALHIETFELLIKCDVNGQAGLRPEFGRELGFDVYTIRNPDGQLEGQCSLCLEKGKPIWIVNQDQEALAATNVYIDRWSGIVDIPPYKDFQSSDNKTLISVPMKRGGERGGEVSGVVDFESRKHLLFSTRAKDEFEHIAAAMSKLHTLLVDNAERHESLDRAIDNLGEDLPSKDFFRLIKPTVFFAFSRTAEEEVVGTIKEVLDRFSEKVEVRVWDELSDSGNITRQIMEEISQCSFGVCYLSEKSRGGDGISFVDNPNVLFEAGMLQALSNNPISEPQNWIPIREAPPPQIPFDFAAERIVQVSRSKDEAALNRAKLIADLSKRITAILDS